MGLRRRLLNRIKRTLAGEEEAETPAPPEPQTYEMPPGTEPPEPEPVSVAPVLAEPVPAEPAPVKPEPAALLSAEDDPAPNEASTSADVTPAAASPAAASPAAESAPAAIPQPGDLPIRIRSQTDSEESWASDYATDDAPVRNAHYRPVFESSSRSCRVRVINEDEGLDTVFECEPGEFVLDAADRAGQELPFSCRSGGCLACSAKMLSGDIEMTEQYVLEDEHVSAFFVLLCCSTPLSDIVVRTHQEDNIQ